MSDDLEFEDRDRDRIRPDRPERTPAPRQPPRERDNAGPTPAPRSGGGAKTVLIVLGVVALFGCCLVCLPAGIGGYFIYEGIGKSRQKQHIANNYKQIGLAMHNYHDTYGTFPTVAMKTRDGKPGLSWRVALLPFLEFDYLYKEFKTDLPWDHPDNSRLASRMPSVYAPRRGAGGDQTHVRLLVGPEALYDPRFQTPRRLMEIRDGTSNTFMLVEATQPVLWIKPEELAFDPMKPLPPLGLPDRDYFLVTYCDGAIRVMPKPANPENLKKMVTANGGEIIDFE